jgi:hypothetical protein
VSVPEGLVNLEKGPGRVPGKDKSKIGLLIEGRTLKNLLSPDFRLITWRNSMF